MLANIDRYPLAWPAGWARTAPGARREADFVTALAQAVHKVTREARRLGAGGVVISCNVALKLDGTPRKGHDPDAIDDVGAAVYFEREETPYCVPSDCWDRIEDNLQAIAMTLEAIRQLRRFSSPEVVDAALRGFQIAPPTGDQASWWQALGLPFDAKLRDAESAYRRMVMYAHPDRGGSEEAMQRLNTAIYQARIQLKDRSMG